MCKYEQILQVNLCILTLNIDVCSAHISCSVFPLSLSVSQNLLCHFYDRMLYMDTVFLYCSTFVTKMYFTKKKKFD